MKDITKYQGVIPAFYACYDAEGNISTEGVKALTRHLIAKGVKGVYVGGSSGECIYQHVDERKAVLEAVMSEAKGKLTVIATSAATTPPTASSWPATPRAWAWMPLHRSRPSTSICRSMPSPNIGTICRRRLPTPSSSSTTSPAGRHRLTMSLLREMLKNPNVVAVKNSSMPTQDIQMFKDAGIAARGEGNFVVFNGPDEQFVSGRVIGADGGIGGTYAVMPELYLAMNEHINKGEIEAARAIQYDADRIIYKMCEAHGNLYAVQKEILRRMYGLELGGVREPMPGLIPEDEPIVAEAQAMIEAAIAKL